MKLHRAAQPRARGTRKRPCSASTFDSGFDLDRFPPLVANQPVEHLELQLGLNRSLDDLAFQLVVAARTAYASPYRLVSRRRRAPVGRINRREASMPNRVFLRPILGFLVTVGMVCSGSLFAQQRGAAQAPQGGAEGPRASSAPAVLKVEWVRPSSQTAQVPVVQENIADPNIQLKEYGPGAKELLTSGTPGSEATPFTVW